MVMGEDLTLGDEHTTQNIGYVLQNCTSESYVILLTSVTSINSIKKQKDYDPQERKAETISKLGSNVITIPKTGR